MRLGMPAVTLLTGLLVAGSAPALADDGIIVLGGLTHFAANGTIRSGSLSGERFTIAGTGAALGGEYEVAIDDGIWASPFVFVSSESAASDNLVYDSATHVTVGARALMRRDEYVFGGQLFVLHESLLGGGVGGVSGTGGGIGGFGRWERGDGVFLGAQLDLTKVSYPDGDGTVVMMNLQVGYRWGRSPGLYYIPPADEAERARLPADVQFPTEAPPQESPPPERAEPEPAAVETSQPELSAEPAAAESSQPEPPGADAAGGAASDANQ